MNTLDSLDKLKNIALNDEKVREELLKTKESDHPLREFCKIANENGCEMSPMDVVAAGEESYAAMRRSTNGGGENAPLLQGEDDLYEMFLMSLI